MSNILLLFVVNKLVSLHPNRLAKTLTIYLKLPRSMPRILCTYDERRERMTQFSSLWKVKFVLVYVRIYFFLTLLFVPVIASKTKNHMSIKCLTWQMVLIIKSSNFYHSRWNCLLCAWQTNGHQTLLKHIVFEGNERFVPMPKEDTVPNHNRNILTHNNNNHHHKNDWRL